MSIAAPHNAPVIDFGTGDATGASDMIREVPVGDFDELSLNMESLGASSILHQSVEILTQHTWSEYLHGRRNRLKGMCQMPASSNGVRPASINLEVKGKGKEDTKQRPQIVWRNICTEEDPPYSVAVSPTRQCVAFGSKAGVELYWVC